MVPDMDQVNFAALDYPEIPSEISEGFVNIQLDQPEIQLFVYKKVTEEGREGGGKYDC